MDLSSMALTATLVAVGFYLTYWAVRLGVRHGVTDVERRRQADQDAVR
jgi:hypothetical protein